MAKEIAVFTYPPPIKWLSDPKQSLGKMRIPLHELISWNLLDDTGIFLFYVGSAECYYKVSPWLAKLVYDYTMNFHISDLWWMHDYLTM